MVVAQFWRWYVDLVEAPPKIPQRRRPASGVFISEATPTIVFLTVCTHRRAPWLIESGVHETLLKVWRDADAWIVGDYLLMPDHVHLFCSPRDREISLDRWVSYWKRMFTLKVRNESWVWQSNHWDTRLRRWESYHEKWNYVRNNPVRKGLVSDADSWPHKGMMNALRW